MAGTAEAASRLDRNEPDPAGARPLQPVPLREDRPVRLGRTADVGAAAGHDGEARPLSQQAVVADVGRPPRDLARLRIGEKGGDDELAFREAADRAEVDRPPSLAEERGEQRHPGRWQHNAEGDEGAETKRRPFEQAAARKPLRAFLLRSCHRGRRRPVGSAGTSHPGETGRDRDQAAEGSYHLWVHDQPDEQDGYADCKAHRLDRGRSHCFFLASAMAVAAEPMLVTANAAAATASSGRERLRVIVLMSFASLGWELVSELRIGRLDPRRPGP